MKIIVTLLFCCGLFGTSEVALAYESRGARSCSQWQEYRQDEKNGIELNASIYGTWLVGYLSGVVAGSGIDFLAGTDNQAVFVLVDVYCDENLNRNLADAGTFVARQMMSEKGIPHQATLP